jgi:hypothetical protein
MHSATSSWDLSWSADAHGFRLCLRLLCLAVAEPPRGVSVGVCRRRCALGARTAPARTTSLSTGFTQTGKLQAIAAPACWASVML